MREVSIHLVTENVEETTTSQLMCGAAHCGLLNGSHFRNVNETSQRDGICLILWI